MQIGLVILDGGGRIVLVNTAAEQILGYRSREVRGKPGGEIFDGLTDLLASLSKERPDSRPDVQLKRNARHKDGRTTPLIVTPHVMPGVQSGAGGAGRKLPGVQSGAGGAGRKLPGDVGPAAGSGVVLVFQDARQLEKMEKQLQHLDRLRSLDEFAAGIVHEIRNPLASISINAQHIVEEIKRYRQKSCTKNDRGDRFLSKIDEEMQDILADVQSIEGIVKRVLDFAHPNRPQVRACAVEDIVKEVLRFSKMPLRRQGIRLVVKSSNDLNTSARVLVDVSQMKQVLFNIVRNACDAMPRGGRLSITTGRVSTGGETSGSRHQERPGPPGNGHVRVEVEDTGRGIAERDLERIFDPFFSMHPDNGSGGTGLGLAISRKIVESHGGRIEVKSTLGKGTKFAVVLPVAGHEPERQ